jgi:hypothetical protein
VTEAETSKPNSSFFELAKRDSRLIEQNPDTYREGEVDQFIGEIKAVAFNFAGRRARDNCFRSTKTKRYSHRSARPSAETARRHLRFPTCAAAWP